MSKRKRQKRSLSQTLLWLISLLMVTSMVASLFIVAIPGPPDPTPTPTPTWTPRPLPTLTPPPTPTLEPSPTPTPEATEPPIGPELPTTTPAVTATLTVTLSPTVEATEPIIGPELPTATPAPTSTPTAASTTFTFAVCGDSLGNPDVYSRVLEAVMADGSEFLFHVGDLVSRGTESRWRAFQETMATFSRPFYPVPGNHDGLDGQLDGYLAYSGAPAAHYAFDREPVHFTLADSHNGGISASELVWLRDNLNATTQPIKMVFLHHPPFDPDGTDHIMAYGNEAFMALMAEQAVDYVFAGHIHAYAREVRDGVVYVITGGAGAPLYGQDHPQAFYHYLRVTVRGEEVAIEVVKI